MEVAGTVKAMVIGAACSGKTCLISRLVDEKLPQTYQKTGEMFSSTKYNTRHGDQEKTYLMQFFEVGDDNDLLYNLYSVMCDVYVVVVDTTNLTGARDSLQLIQKIRATSPSAGSSRIITVMTKVEASNNDIMLPDLGEIYPNVTTSSKLDIGMDDLKMQILLSSKQGKKTFQRSISESFLKAHKGKQLNQQVDEELDRLYSISEERLSEMIYEDEFIEPSPRRRGSSLYSCRPPSPLVKAAASCAQQERKVSFTETQKTEINPIKTLQMARKANLFHLCHLIEVPPITFPDETDDSLTDKVHKYLGNVKLKVSGLNYRSIFT